MLQRPLLILGLFSPSSGTGIVNGYDIRTNIDDVRNSLGMCPQHNVLFDELTVEEHMYFFCKVGISFVRLLSSYVTNLR